MVEWFPTKSGRKKASKRSNRPKKKAASSTTKPKKSDPLASGSGSAEQMKTKSTSTTPVRDDSARSERRKKKKKEDRRKKEEDEGEEEEAVDNRRSEQIVATVVDAPKNVDIKNQEIDEDKMKNLLVKFRNEKLKPQKALAPLDAKERLLMDRVLKKPYPLKYAMKGHDALLFEETSSFFRPSAVLKKQSGSMILAEDSYSHAPRWKEVKKMPEDSPVVVTCGLPDWAVMPEPTEEDTVGVDNPISVGSQHIEMFNDKAFELKTIKEAVKVVMDEWQPLIEIMKRDELHFHPHLVFSNTIRSLINVQDGKSDPSLSNKEEENGRKSKRTGRFDADSPRKFGYSRQRPIGSARELLAQAKRDNSIKTTTTTTTTTSTEGTVEKA